MPFKLLIDECLSPELVDMAVAAGHVEATCVRNRGWLGAKDHGLLFEFALVELASMDDLINQALEVSEAPDGSISIALYEIP